MKSLHGFLLAIWLTCAPAEAQITFLASDFPSQVGQYSRAYISTNVDVSGLLSLPGGPWDFSQKLQPNELVRRLDIVAPGNGGHNSSFPNAAYAERYTDETGGAQEWDYYRITPNAGRTNYGFYNDALGGASTCSPPTLDVPWTLRLGTNWSYTTDLIGSPFGPVHVIVSASVDAYGTVILPQLREVAALRVNQLTSEQTFFGVQYFREYYWLVPGLGRAVHVVSTASSSPPPNTFTDAYEVRRMFEANSLTNSPPLTPAANLRIRVQGGEVTLSWQQATNVSGYLVNSLATLAANNWQTSGLPSINSWSEPLTSTQRFYRVFIRP